MNLVIVPDILVCGSFLISVGMFIVSKSLLISSATVIVRAGEAIWLNPFATVCSAVTVEFCVLYPCFVPVGSRNLAKYCADSSSECSLAFSFYMHVVDTGHRVVIHIASFCVYQIGLNSKQKKHNCFISRPPGMSSAMFSSIVPKMYLPTPWGYFSAGYSLCYVC